MADITMGPSRLERHLATMPGVQDAIEEYTFEARVRAEEILADHKFTGNAFIEVEKGDIDRYLVLSDERGQKAALAIEYGRTAYDVLDEDGNVAYTVGAMEGLYVLHKATQLRIKRKAKVKV